MGAARHFPDDVLMAFADGELDDPRAAEVAEAIDADPDVAARVAMFMQTRQAARQAFGSIMAEPVPARLLQAVAEGPSRAAMPLAAASIGRQVPPPVTVANENLPGRWRPLLLAASAALAAGLIGYLAASGQRGAPDALASLAGSPAALGRFLEETAEGQRRTFGTGQSAAAEVTGTYRLADGRVCRAIRLDHAASGSAAEALSCRDRDRWRLELAAPLRPADAGFRPAGAGLGVDAALDAAGAGERLPANEVEQLARRGWR